MYNVVIYSTILFLAFAQCLLENPRGIRRNVSNYSLIVFQINQNSKTEWSG